MNLRKVANSVTQTVNPNITVTVRHSTGFTVGAGMKQVPSYDDTPTPASNLQALDGSDLKQLDGLNIQGDLRAIYVYGPMAAVIRPSQVGGDLIILPDTSEWLVVKMLETWPDWCKACIVRQGPVPDA